MDKEQQGDEQEYEKYFAKVIDHVIRLFWFKKLKEIKILFFLRIISIFFFYYGQKSLIPYAKLFFNPNAGPGTEAKSPDIGYGCADIAIGINTGNDFLDTQLLFNPPAGIGAETKNPQVGISNGDIAIKLTSYDNLPGPQALLKPVVFTTGKGQQLAIFFKQKDFAGVIFGNDCGGYKESCKENKE
jgi:hypothetical protein